MKEHEKIVAFKKFIDDLYFEDFRSIKDKDISWDLIHIIEDHHEDNDFYDRINSLIEDHVKNGETIWVNEDLVVEVYAEALGFFVGTSNELIESLFDNNSDEYFYMSHLDSNSLDDWILGYVLFDDGYLFLSPEEQKEFAESVKGVVQKKRKAAEEAYSRAKEILSNIEYAIEKNFGDDLSVTTIFGDSLYLEVWNDDTSVKIRVSDHENTSGLHDKPDMNLPIDIFHDEDVQLADFECFYIKDSFSAACRISWLIESEFEIELPD